MPILPTFHYYCKSRSHFTRGSPGDKTRADAASNLLIFTPFLFHDYIHIRNYIFAFRYLGVPADRLIKSSRPGCLLHEYRTRLIKIGTPSSDHLRLLFHRFLACSGYSFLVSTPSASLPPRGASPFLDYADEERSRQNWNSRHVEWKDKPLICRA